MLSEDVNLRDPCSNSPVFWKEIIIKFIGEQFAYAKALASGIQYKYSILKSGDEWALTPLPFYGAIRKPENPGDVRYSIEIPGLLPVKGTLGYYYGYLSNGYDQFQDDGSIFGLDSRQSTLEALRGACNKMAKSFYNYYATDALDEGDGTHLIAVSLDSFDDLDDMELDIPVTADFYSDMLYDQFLLLFIGMVMTVSNVEVE
jgi:hypothetical protein